MYKTACYSVDQVFFVYVPTYIPMSSMLPTVLVITRYNSNALRSNITLLGNELI